MTFKELASLYFKNYKTKVRRITYDIKRYMFERALQDTQVYNSEDIKGIIENDLIDLKEYLLKKYTSNTVRTIYSIIINIFYLAEELKYIDNNVALAIGNIPATGNTNKIRVISKEDFSKVLSAITDKQFEKKIFLKFLFHTGLRSSEARALKWGDLDNINKLLIVDKSIYCKKYDDYELTDTKTKSSRRCIMLDRNILSDLTELRSVSPYCKNEDFIFNRGGMPHPQHYAKDVLRYSCRKAAVTEVSTHGLRHSHVSHLIRNNVNMKLIQKRVGHSNASITLNTYAHLFAEDESEILSLFE